MRKDAFNLCLSTLVLGIFGFFLRWLQNMNSFEPETGLHIPGSGTSAVFLGFCAAALILLLLADRFYILRRCSLPADQRALCTATPLHRIAAWLPSVVIALCCLILMFSADGAAIPLLARATAAVGILAAAALPFMFVRPDSLAPKAQEQETGQDADRAAIPAVAALVPILFACLWMVNGYVSHAENPVLWQYVTGVLATVALCIGFRCAAACFYRRCKPGRYLFALQLAAYLCIVTLADSRSTAETLLFGAMAFVMLLLQFLLIENAEIKK